MAKMIVGDSVAIVKPHDVNVTPCIVYTGVLAALDRGLRTTDRRAKAQEGGPCENENEVDAPGWAVVRLSEPDGHRFSVSLKNVKLLTRVVQERHDMTMREVEMHLAKRKEQEAELQSLKDLCTAAGFDVSTLTEGNVRVAAGLLQKSKRTENTAAVVPQPEASASV